MRLDANRGDVGWLIFDVGRCEWLNRVVWLDTRTCLYAEIDLDETRARRERVEVIRLAREIRLFPSCKLAVIFPVDARLARWAA